MQKYKIIKILGDGAFGTVYHAVNNKTNQKVAIKKMKSKYSNWEQCLQLRQIKSLRKINHPNIIKLKEVLLVSEQLYMVFEFLQSNLYEQYSKRKQQGRMFTQKEIKNMLFQLASALAHMHKNGFFHRDLKPENILIQGNVLKLCDFGLARQIRSRPPFTDYVSTRWYRAPQLLLRSTNYNSPVDAFAFGCIAAQLYNLSPLFPGNNDVDQLNRIIKTLGTPDISQWPQGYKLAKAQNYKFAIEIGINLSELIPRANYQAINLIQSTLIYSSRKRSTMLEILKHDYFKGIQQVQINQDKQIIFQQKKIGNVLDESKHDKIMEQFRLTKQKFRQTRRHDALNSDPFKYFDKNSHKVKEESQQDIDKIIKQLQQKKNKKHKVTEKIIKNTRQKFYTEVQTKKQREQKYPSPYIKPVKKMPPSPSKQVYQYNKPVIGSRDQSRKVNNIFSYGFQPSLPSLYVNNIQRQYQTPGTKVNRSKHINNNYYSQNNIQKQFELNYKQKGKVLTPLISQFRY